MGAGLSEQFEWRCCTSRHKEQKLPAIEKVPPRKTPLILTCNAVQAALATSPKSIVGADDFQADDSVGQAQTTADGSWDNASMLTTSTASRGLSTEDVTQPRENTSVEANTNTNAIEGEAQGSLGMPQVREVGNCDAWTTPEVLNRENTLTNWYSNPEGSGCNNDTSASDQDVAQQTQADQTLSNWYTGSSCAEVAAPPPTNTMGLPVLGQAPCHYYTLSSFVDESKVNDHDETLDSFQLVQGSQTQVEGSVAAMKVRHPMA